LREATGLSSAHIWAGERSAKSLLEKMRLILTVEVDLKPCAAAIDRERPERARLDFAVIEPGSDLVHYVADESLVVLRMRTKKVGG
jgi:hypothetical protein